MKMKIWSRRTLKKISSVFICLGLILGGTGISPTVSAKTVYKTKVHNFKLEKKEDFEKGEKKSIKMVENGDQIELLSEGEAGEYITAEVQAPFEATHVGLHWQENSAKEQLLAVSLRVRNEGEEFGDWIEVNSELEDHPDDWKTDEIFASLVNVGNKKYAQAKINFVSQDGKTPKLKNFTFTFLNSGEITKETVKELNLIPKTGAESVGVTKTSIGGQSVNVIPREMWGADESYRLKADGQEDWPRSYHGTRKLVIHHTAVKGSNGETDIAKNMEEVRSIYYYHAVTQKWGDIGYNALVDAAGNVYEGRYGTHGTDPTRTNPTADQIMTPDVEAGHTAGYNSGSFGVAAMGEFTRFTPPTAQIEGLKKVLAYVADERGTNAQGSSNFLRYDKTWHEDLYNFIGHREAVATACPGDKLYNMIQTSIKNPVDALLHHNLGGFGVIYNGTIDMESFYTTKVGSGTLDFSWDRFTDDDTLKVASGYQYMLERVFGTVGDASDSQPWETAWFFAENAENVKTTPETNVRVDSSALQSNSNYVFYVRALDENGKPLSTTKHFNFETGEIIPTEPVDPDEVIPSVSISAPTENTIVSGDSVVIAATASDNIGVVKVEFYANDALIGSDSSAPYSINW
ncbi:MAG: Ig-like domain-containing protein, partial [Candidatus Moranbacteria bacterium]|nr:Ig-like domain-containing protein [Candidatus Moranbacteria bacterium]